MYTIESVSIFSDGLDHPECVAIHPDGSVWAGGEAGQVYRISADGKETQKVCDTGGFNLGIAFSPGATWLAICDLKHHSVWKLDLDSNTLTKFASSVDSSPLNIPNYPVFDDEGNLYVSESGAFRSITGKIYRFDTTGNGVVWHSGPFNFANGMALSPDRQYLYVVCTWLPGVERIEIGKDGSPQTREIYVRMPETCPDGVAFDEEGNLYVSCYAPNTIYRVNKNRELKTLIHDWESHTLSNPTNIAFGGPGFDELFFANLGRWHIGKIKLQARGLKLACHK